MTKSRLLATIALLALSACNKQTEKQVQAGGEILPGSASDAMLPLDTVTSQPPLAPKVDKVPSTGKASAEPAAAAQLGADVAPAPAPAAPDTPPG